MTWNVSVADVLSETAVTVTTGQVAQADSMITIYVNRSPAASAGIGGRDLGWIKRAICWQAAWLSRNPDVVSRMQFDSLSQDGTSVSSSAQWAKVLAPMAARSIKNLSWKGTRSVGARPVDDLWRGGDFVLESSDEYSSWSPL